MTVVAILPTPRDVFTKSGAVAVDLQFIFTRVWQDKISPTFKLRPTVCYRNVPSEGGVQPNPSIHAYLTLMVV